MTADPLGLTISATDPADVAAIRDFVEGLLGYETRAVAVLERADAGSADPLVNLYAGVIRLFAEAPGAGEAAAPYLARATGGNPRERALAGAVGHWAAGDVDALLAGLERVLAEWPTDLVALKLHHYHDFNRGNFAAMLRVAQGVAAANAHVAWMHGMVAFACEQCHLLDDAEAHARRALAMARGAGGREPWAEHALAHVMLTRGRIDEGIGFLEAASGGWAGLNSFMLTHLWWHLALFYLSRGRFADALAAYDGQVWAVAKDYSQDQVGAVSLLARIELAGIDVGPRWAELGEHLAARAADVEQPFLSVQYAYGLARAGRPEAERLTAAIGAAPGAVWREVALPLAEGLLAHARGDHQGAVRRLDAAMPRLAEIGGSHAQRDLFDQVLLDAVIGMGADGRAQQMLELRRAHDPDGVPLNRALGGVYRRLGLEPQARAAEARAA